MAYLPGWRDAPGRRPVSRAGQTDARDAFIIVATGRTVPHTLRGVDTDDDTLAELDVLVGFDDDLAGEVVRTANRDLRGLLTGIHPPRSSG